MKKLATGTLALGMLAGIAGLAQEAAPQQPPRQRVPMGNEEAR